MLFCSAYSDMSYDSLLSDLFWQSRDGNGARLWARHYRHTLYSFLDSVTPCPPWLTLRLSRSDLRVSAVHLPQFDNDYIVDRGTVYGLSVVPVFHFFPVDASPVKWYVQYILNEWMHNPGGRSLRGCHVLTSV